MQNNFSLLHVLIVRVLVKKLDAGVCLLVPAALLLSSMQVLTLILTC